MAVLPPKVSAANFAAAIREFEAALTKEWVLTSDEDLAPYRDPFSMYKDQPNDLVASAAVCPTEVEQVQAVVRTANKYKIPLYAISTGKNYAYGSASPSVRGAVVVDLKRMNKVIEVDADRHFALVEAGVSYFELYRHIQDRGLKVWIDTPDPGWGSPVGNTMDHGIGYTLGFYRDHKTAMYGVEVVLPSGEVMRTGMGAMEGAKTWQEYKHGFGPDPAGLFAQGNLGIVTKMGIRLMPQPEHWRNGLITVPKRRDINALVKTVNYLTDLFMIGEPWYGSPLRALMGNTEFREAATRRGGLNEAELDRMAAAAGLHAWQVELQFYGSEGTTKAGWEYAKELVAKAIPGARMTDGESLKVPLTRAQLENTTGPYPTNMRRNVTQGVPGLGVWYQTGRTDGSSDRWAETHIGLFSVIPRSGDAIMAAQEAFIDIGHELGFPAGSSAIATPVNWHQFAFMMGNGFLTAQDFSPEGKKKQAALLRRIIETNAKHGWGDYRAPPVLQDAVAESYGWNNHVLRRFNETLKDAVDPNGIFSPGRGGIWPKAFRHLRGSFSK